MTSSIRKARTILKAGGQGKTRKRHLLVSDLGVGELATVGSSDGSLGSGESSESGGSQSGDASKGLASASLQVLDRELATYHQNQ